MVDVVFIEFIVQHNDVRLVELVVEFFVQFIVIVIFKLFQRRDSAVCVERGNGWSFCHNDR